MPLSTDGATRHRSRNGARGGARAGPIASCAALFALAWVAEPARAQIIFDDSFGAPGLAPSEDLGATLVIEQARGRTVANGGRTHLFHSFERFGVAVDQTAEFRTDDAVDTILSRVTGSDPSQIDGGLRVRSENGLGAPDLLLLNPNGILFGGQSRLDMDGLFTASTADAVGFANGETFWASDLLAPLPVDAAPPSLLRFAEVADGEPGIASPDITIAGRIVSNDAGGARDAAGIVLVGRRLEATGPGFLVAEQGTIGLAAVGDGALDVPSELAQADVRPGDTLTGSIRIGGGGAAFNVSTLGPNPDQGRIVIRAGRLTLVEAGLLAGGGGEGRAIDVEVADTVRIEGSAGKIESVAGGDLPPGELRISATALELRDGGSLEHTNNGAGDSPGSLRVEVDRLSIEGLASQIHSTTRGTGAGGKIAIEVDGELQIAQQGRILSESLADSNADVGASGDVTIDAARLVIDGDRRLVEDVPIASEIRSTTRDAGRGGNLTLRIGETIDVRDAGQIVADSRSEGGGGIGAAGDLTIETAALALASNAGLLTVTNAAAPAGDLAVSAHSIVMNDAARIQSGSNDPDGTGGDVDLTATRLELDGGSFIGTGPAPRGAAGPDDGAPDALGGPPGRVDLRADALTLRDGSQISTTTDGVADAGDLDLTVVSRFVAEGRQPGTGNPSGVFARSGRRLGATASGAGGELAIHAGRIELGPGGELGTQTFGTGTAGDLAIEVAGDLVLRGGNVSAEATDIGRPGDLRIKTGGNLLVSDGGALRASAPVPRPGVGGPGDPAIGGDIDLVIGGRLELIDATIRTDSARPASGNVAIDVAGPSAIVDSEITTNVDTPAGQGGDLRLETTALAIAGSRLRADASQLNADAGNILLQASSGIVRSPDSEIRANAELGVSGSVVLAGPETNLAGELGVLAADYRERPDTLRDPCAARRTRTGSFEISPRRAPRDTSVGTQDGESNTADRSAARPRNSVDGCPLP